MVVLGHVLISSKIVLNLSIGTERPAKLATPAKPVFTCTGCKTVLVLPIPSTVVTAIPSTAHNGIKQPFAEKCLVNVKVRGHKVNST